MTNPVKITEKNSAAMRNARRLLKKRRKKLRLGVLEGDAVIPHPESEDNATYGEIAVWNEYGTQDIPARSWLNGFIAENLDKIANDLATDTRRVIFAGADERDALVKRGKKYVTQIRKRIKNRIPPPNAPATLRRKKGDIPLIDFGHFIKRIKFEVKD